MLGVVDQSGNVRDELGELGVPLGEEELGAGLIGVLVNGLLVKFVIQSFLVWIITIKTSDVLASLSGLPGGISSTFHESIMVGILLEMGN